MGTKIDLDYWTSLVRNSINTLTLANPVKTAFGSLFGMVIFVLVHFSAKIELLPEKSLEIIEWWYFVILGIFIINIKNFYYQINNRDEFPLGIQRSFSAIEKMENSGNFTKKEIKSMYQGVYQNIVKRINVKDDKATSIKTSNR